MTHPLKTPDEARAFHFIRTGKTIKSWAKENGLHPATVIEVLSGRRKCLRGDAHKAAVLLGIKDGVIEE